MTLTKMTRFYLNLSSILCVLILSFCHFLVFYNFLIFSMKIKNMGTFQHKVRTNYCKKLLFVVSLQKKTCTRQFESRTFIALVCIFFAKEKPALMLPRGRLLRPREVTIDDRRRSSIMTPKVLRRAQERWKPKRRRAGRRADT